MVVAILLVAILFWFGLYLISALPHKNLPFSASSISFPPTLNWSLLQGRNVALGCLCLNDWVPSYICEVAPQLCRRGAADTSTPRPRQYRPEVQHALFLAWHVASRICAKGLITFLSPLIEALERHEHLHLTEECSGQLLSMSAAKEDRLLRSQCKLGHRGISTTRVGTLLKQRIPICIFKECKETRPGFLEADLVAYWGTDFEGGYLCTFWKCGRTNGKRK